MRQRIQETPGKTRPLFIFRFRQQLGAFFELPKIDDPFPSVPIHPLIVSLRGSNITDRDLEEQTQAFVRRHQLISVSLNLIGIPTSPPIPEYIVWPNLAMQRTIGGQTSNPVKKQVAKFLSGISKAIRFETRSGGFNVTGYRPYQLTKQRYISHVLDYFSQQFHAISLAQFHQDLPQHYPD